MPCSLALPVRFFKSKFSSPSPSGKARPSFIVLCVSLPTARGQSDQHLLRKKKSASHLKIFCRSGQLLTVSRLYSSNLFVTPFPVLWRKRPHDFKPQRTTMSNVLIFFSFFFKPYFRVSKNPRSEREKRECGKVKPLTGPRIRSTKFPVTNALVSMYVYLPPPYVIQSDDFLSAPRTVERHFACEIVDLLAPLPFDNFFFLSSFRSTVLTSAGSPRLAF